MGVLSHLLPQAFGIWVSLHYNYSFSLNTIVFEELWVMLYALEVYSMMVKIY